MCAKRCHRLFIPVVAIIAAAIMPAPAGAAETPTLDEIKAKTAERLAALEGKEIKIEWTSERDVPVGSISANAPRGLLGPRGRTMKIETVPAEPMTLPGRGTLLIRGESARSDSFESGLFATENRPPVEHHFITILHDKVCTWHDPESKGANISSNDRLFGEAKNMILAWFATDKHLDPSFGSKTEWSVESREIEGKQMIVLHRSPPESHGRIQELLLDPARGYLPIKLTHSGVASKGWKGSESVAEYAERPDGIWTPKGGTLKPNGGRAASDVWTIRVSSVSIDPASADTSIFKLEFPEGTRLVKEDEKGFYIVGKDGQLEPDPRVPPPVSPAFAESARMRKGK